MQSEAQLLLRKSSEEALGAAVSANYVVKGSGGQSTPAFVSWIAVFNPFETSHAQHGMYAVDPFKADMTGVYLSLNHGVTELVNQFGRQQARETLANQATEIRANMPALPPT
ncbi:MAG: MrcB family domain-containing protein [Mycobacterium sp.]